MPEYSSTTITPADGVKTPAMNGSTSGNYELSALKAYILASKGLANGLASLDANGKLPTSQLPDLADDVLVYGSYALLPSPGTAGKLYITADDNKMYRWDDALTTPDYVVLSVDLSDYATEAELTDVKNALQATNKRVTNLEQKAGDEIVVDYPSSTYGMDEVPANVAEYAKVVKLRGVTRVWNQLVPNNKQTFSNTTTDTKTKPYIGVRINTSPYTPAPFDNGDNFKSITSTGLFAGVVSPIYNLSYMLQHSGDQENIVLDNNLFTAVAGHKYLILINFIGIDPTTVGGMSYDKCCVTDLNIYFGGTIPSDADTIAEIQTNYPELLIPSDYDAGSLVSTEYSAIESVRKNIFDTDTILGNVTGWTKQADGSWKGYSMDMMNAYSNGIPQLKMKYGERYALSVRAKNTSFSGESLYIGFYYTDGTRDRILVNGTTSTTYTVISASGKTISFVGCSYANNAELIIEWIQLEMGTSVTSYSPYKKTTLSLPSPVELNATGDLKETCIVESGVKQKYFNKFTINASDVVNLSQTGGLHYNVAFTNIRKSDALAGIDLIAVAIKGMATNIKYQVANINVYWSTNLKIGVAKNSDVFIVDNSLTTLDEFKALCPIEVVYAIDPTTEQLTPILDPFIEVEGGGTIRPIQTQTTEIDSAMTAEYLSLGA